MGTMGCTYSLDILFGKAQGRVGAEVEENRGFGAPGTAKSGVAQKWPVQDKPAPAPIES
jgi:hypothetical protein